MTDTPDFAALAREYLDLWQEQLTAMAADPTLAAQSARFFEAMGQAETTATPQATAQMAAMAQQFMKLAGLAAGGKADNDDSTPQSAPEPTRGTPPPAAAPDDSHEQLAELASRLTALEERLDRMEAGNSGARGGAKSATGKRAGAKSKNGPKRKQSKPKSK